MSDTTPRRTPPRLLRVRRITQLTPQMRRITLAGEALAGFPVDSDGAHIKLMLPRAHQIDPVLPTLGPDGPIWPPAEERPITRTYTVGHYDEAAGELDVDFVLHGDNGPASSWALHAKPGDAIGVAGPGGPNRIHAGADWYLVVADPSSMAMVHAVLAEMPEDARGQVLIEVPDSAEIQPLKPPAGVAVEWLSREGAHAGESTLLLDFLRAMDWPAGKVSVTIAGENAQVVAIRDFVLKERGVTRQTMYAVPYWKDLHTEEAYHQERHRIMDEQDAA